MWKEDGEWPRLPNLRDSEMCVLFRKDSSLTPGAVNPTHALVISVGRSGKSHTSESAEFFVVGRLGLGSSSGPPSTCRVRGLWFLVVPPTNVCPAHATRLCVSSVCSGTTAAERVLFDTVSTSFPLRYLPPRGLTVQNQ